MKPVSNLPSLTSEDLERASSTRARRRSTPQSDGGASGSQRRPLVRSTTAAASMNETNGDARRSMNTRRALSLTSLATPRTSLSTTFRQRDTSFLSTVEDRRNYTYRILTEALEIADSIASYPDVTGFDEQDDLEADGEVATDDQNDEQLDQQQQQLSSGSRVATVASVRARQRERRRLADRINGNNNNNQGNSTMDRQ